MSEKRVIFNSGHLKIEGLYNRGSSDRGVVVAHPHPQYGGNMLNNVVEDLCLAYNECGYSSMRFNFRGTGRSEGVYDNGDGELKDLEGAISFLSDSGIKEIDLAGYSFGSWIIALGIKRYKKDHRLIMVSPPVDLFDYSSLLNNSQIRLVISGSEDNIADWRSIEKVIPLWNPDVKFMVINGADHFYFGRSDDIKKIVTEFLKQG